jgi:excinuclease UvrABC nuclease subunit
MNIIDKLVTLLEEEKILPVSEETWTKFELNHYSPKNDEEKNEQFSFIKGQVQKKAGIYVYIKNGKCMYIGKAKLLYDRIKSHYIECFSPVPGDTKDMRWHRFFSQNQGEVEVYWKEFKTEEERKIIEMLLTKILNPIFLSFK